MKEKLLTASRFVDMNTKISYRYILSDTLPEKYYNAHNQDEMKQWLKNIDLLAFIQKLITYGISSDILQGIIK